jgi:hypothetical protein
MAPYLELPRRWPDVQAGFITAIRDQLQPQLVPRYIAQITPYVAFEQIEIAPARRAIVPDVDVHEREEPGVPKVSATIDTPPLLGTTLMELPTRYARIEIRAIGEETLVTAIELLSPVNKRPGAEGLSGVDVFAGSPWNAVGRIGSGRCSNTAFPALGRAADAQKRVPTTTCLHLRGAEGSDAYEKKRQELFRSGAHLLEIDRLRNGRRPQVAHPKTLPDAPYFILLSRAERRPEIAIWPCPLQQPLPTVSVPLRYPDPDVALALTRVVQQVYRNARYDLQVDYRTNPPPPDLAPDDAAWIDARLRERGLPRSASGMTTGDQQR